MIRPHANAAEYWFHEGCFITEWSNAPDDPAASIARARVPAGRRTRLHRLHGTVERYLVLDGSGVVETGSEPATLQAAAVGPYDVVVIPAGHAQRIANVGAGDLVFVAICTPRFEPGAYEALEDATESATDPPDLPDLRRP
jgi:mannose-6-phosphate isomerase-like protein (cupin superfamily)